MRLVELTHDISGEVKYAAVEALKGKANEPEVLSRLLELIDDEEWMISWRAAKTLREVAGNLHIQTHLLKLAQDQDHDEVSRGSAVEALNGAVTAPAV